MLDALIFHYLTLDSSSHIGLPAPNLHQIEAVSDWCGFKLVKYYLSFNHVVSKAPEN